MAITRILGATAISPTIPASAGGTGATSFAPGKVLQVKSFANSSLNQASTNSSSFQDVSGLDVVITPSSASNYMQIWVMYHVDTGGSGHGVKGDLSSIIGSTQADVGGIGGISTNITADRQNTFINNLYYHTPNTTNAVTYRFRFKSATNGQTVYFNRNAYRIVVNELDGTGA
tara:strand:+ start:120 stop:638 length:519 start_codon:yes stop_codon:yes gene_type:complete